MRAMLGQKTKKKKNQIIQEEWVLKNIYFWCGIILEVTVLGRLT